MKITQFQAAAPSPFDSIKQTRPDGTPFWSARDLMPLLGYAEWRKFEGAIERAKISADNSNIPSVSHIVGAAKLVKRPQGGGNMQEDYDLTRFGAYLVAMNGDPRKPEIAAAQAYFVVKTREAETRPVAALPFDISDPESILVYSLQLAKEAKIIKMELEAANTQLAEAAPKVEAYEQIANATGTCSVATAAQELNMGQKELFELLRDDGILIAEGIRRNTPFQQYLSAGYFIVKDTMIEQLNESRPTTRVTPRGRLWLAKRYGNPASYLLRKRALATQAASA
jgi:DNA-damage-inducible protein D